MAARSFELTTAEKFSGGIKLDASTGSPVVTIKSGKSLTGIGAGVFAVALGVAHVWVAIQRSDVRIGFGRTRGSGGRRGVPIEHHLPIFLLGIILITIGLAVAWVKFGQRTIISPNGLVQERGRRSPIETPWQSIRSVVVRVSNRGSWRTLETLQVCVVTNDGKDRRLRILFGTSEESFGIKNRPEIWRDLIHRYRVEVVGPWPELRFDEERRTGDADRHRKVNAALAAGWGVLSCGFYLWATGGRLG